jgi:hypothetical protein
VFVSVSFQRPWPGVAALVVRLIMRIACFMVIFVLLVGCTMMPEQSAPHAHIDQPTRIQPQIVAGDPIDKLVTNLSASPLWINGFCHYLDLPSSASPEDVVAGALQSYRLQDYTVVATREVVIAGGLAPHDKYTAALIRSSAGQKIVLFYYSGQSAKLTWWSRVYDVSSA